MSIINLDHTDIAILDTDSFEIAESLMDVVEESSCFSDYDIDVNQVARAIYSLQRDAQNEYNDDSFRHLYAALALMANM